MVGKKIVADKPTHLIAPNDKVSNTLFRSTETDELKKTELFKRFFNGGMDINTVNKEEAFVNVKLKSELTKPFTIFDGLVYAAICSLVCNPLIKNSGYFTTKMVYDAMRQGTGIMSDEMKEKIEASIDRMAMTLVTIDYEQEVQYFSGLEPQVQDDFERERAAALKKLNRITKGKIGEKSEDVQIVKTEVKKYALTENMLYVSYIDTELKINGRKVDRCYQVLELPVLYRYALMKKQVIMIPYEKIRTKKSISISSMLIKDILIKRIYQMKSKSRKVPKKIALSYIYNAVFSELGIDDLTPESRKWQEEKIRAKVKSTLTDFVKNGFIADFKVNKQKQKISSYEIVLKKTQKRS